MRDECKCCFEESRKVGENIEVFISEEKSNCMRDRPMRLTVDSDWQGVSIKNQVFGYRVASHRIKPWKWEA